MSITERDNRLIKEWFEPYKYATVGILEKVFFPSDYGYTVCRKRLLELLKEDYIKCVKDETNNKNIYIYNENKISNPSYHRLVLLNLLAEIRYLGFNVERFEIEKSWCNNKYKSDAFLQFTVDNLGDEKGKRCYFFVEVQTSNNHHRLEKYDEIYSTGEVQNYLAKDKTFYPKVLIVSDRHFNNVSLQNTKVLQVKTNLKSLCSIIL